MYDNANKKRDSSFGKVWLCIFHCDRSLKSSIDLKNFWNSLSSQIKSWLASVTLDCSLDECNA